ncbi:MAG: (2Fe-2S) ferredoxin domain-containing protein [Prochlorothrix sp.]
MAEIWVCQHHTCRHQGSKAVLAMFRQEIDRLWQERGGDRPPHGVYGAGCLGHCGSGPMVVAVPGERWFYRVQPETVEDVLRELE